MSKAISLKLEATLFAETERLLRTIRMPRNAYINRAIAFYNRCQTRRLRKQQLGRDVARLRDDTRACIVATELLEDLPE